MDSITIEIKHYNYFNRNFILSYLETYICHLNVEKLFKRESTPMNITLINPLYPQNVQSHPPFIPLGIAYLGAVTEK